MPTTGPRIAALELLARAAAFKDAASRTWRRARHFVAEAKDELERAAGKSGLPTKPAAVIDVGERPGRLTRMAQAAAGALVLALLFGSAVSLTFFASQLLLAWLISTQVLGLRIDLNPPGAA